MAWICSKCAKVNNEPDQNVCSTCREARHENLPSTPAPIPDITTEGKLAALTTRVEALERKVYELPHNIGILHEGPLL